MLADSDLIAFVGSTDASKAKTFYRDRLGLQLVSEETGHALVFDANGTMLRVSLVQEIPTARYTVLGWRVDNIEAAVEELKERGVVFERFEGFSQDAHGIWTAPDGTKVAWFQDLDGNVLSLTEFAHQEESQPK